MSDRTAYAVARFAAEIDGSGTTCTVTRAGAGGPTTNPTTGDVTWPDATVVYEGGCLLTPLDNLDRVLRRGGETEYADRYQWTGPRDVVPAIGDRITITGSTTDPALVGAVFEVRPVPVGTFMARRRVTVERTTIGQAT